MKVIKFGKNAAKFTLSKRVVNKIKTSVDEP